MVLFARFLNICAEFVLTDKTKLIQGVAMFLGMSAYIITIFSKKEQRNKENLKIK
jgi:hypothetical protein